MSSTMLRPRVESRANRAGRNGVADAPNRRITLRARLVLNISGYGREARLASYGAHGDDRHAHLGGSVSLSLENLERVLAPFRERLEREAVVFDAAPSFAEMTTALESIVRAAYPDGEVVSVRIDHIPAPPPMTWIKVGGGSSFVAAPVGAVIALHENAGDGTAGAPIGFTWGAGDAGQVQVSTLLVLRP